MLPLLLLVDLAAEDSTRAVVFGGVDLDVSCCACEGAPVAEALDLGIDGLESESFLRKASRAARILAPPPAAAADDFELAGAAEDEAAADARFLASKLRHVCCAGARWLGQKSAPQSEQRMGTIMIL